MRNLIFLDLLINVVDNEQKCIKKMFKDLCKNIKRKQIFFFYKSLYSKDHVENVTLRN